MAIGWHGANIRQHPTWWLYGLTQFMLSVPTSIVILTHPTHPYVSPLKNLVPPFLCLSDSISSLRKGVHLLVTAGDAAVCIPIIYRCRRPYPTRHPSHVCAWAHSIATVLASLSGLDYTIAGVTYLSSWNRLKVSIYLPSRHTPHSNYHHWRSPSSSRHTLSGLFWSTFKVTRYRNGK